MNRHWFLVQIYRRRIFGQQFTFFLNIKAIISDKRCFHIEKIPYHWGSSLNLFINVSDGSLEQTKSTRTVLGVG